MRIRLPRDDPDQSHEGRVIILHKPGQPPSGFPLAHDSAEKPAEPASQVGPVWLEGVGATPWVIILHKPGQPPSGFPLARDSAEKTAEPDAQARPVWIELVSAALLPLGLVGVAIADTAARSDLAWAQPLFWLALLVLIVPAGLRLAGTLTTAEAARLVALVGLALYLVKVLYSPLGFTLHDEFMHYRTLDDIVTTGHVVMDNPLLPESPLYPALELATAALTTVTGLSYFVSGLLVVGAARLVLVLALFFIYRQLSASTRVAGIACLIYMCNPNFVFFDVVFSYESLALSFLMVVLYVAVSSQHIGMKGRAGPIALLVLTLGALVMSHHITTYALVGFLVLWLLADYYAYYYKGPGGRDAGGPAWLAPLTFVVTLAWLILMGGATVGYLGPHIWGAFTEMTSILHRTTAGAQAGGAAGRQLFVSTTGQVSPLWERVSGFGAVGLLMLALPFGTWEVWRARRKMSSITMAFVVTALIYPVTLLFRLTSAGWEAANRSSEFVFLGLAFVIALGLCRFLVVPNARLWRRGVFAACLALVFSGGLIAGWPPSWRMPWPYEIDPDTAGGARDITAQGLQAADWVLAHLGPSNRIGGDPTNMLLLGSFGRQHTQSTLSGGVNTEWALYAPQITDDQAGLLRRGKVQYLVVDRRLITAPVLGRRYYPLASLDGPLAKFDYLERISRIFDDGAIAIYDVGAMSGAP